MDLGRTGGRIGDTHASGILLSQQAEYFESRVLNHCGDVTLQGVDREIKGIPI
jgi:hypothetical protein